MKIFANTKIWKKIVIVMTLIFSISVIEPEPVEANIPGGELLNPINYFVLAVGDAIMQVVHIAVLHQPASMIRVNTKETISEKIIKIVVAIVAIAAIATAIGLAANVFSAVLMVMRGVATFVTLSSGVAIVGTMYAIGFFMDGEVVLPLFRVTPEAIFKNSDELPLFSVNFWNPDKREIEVDYSGEITEEIEKNKYVVKDTTPETIQKLNYQTATFEGIGRDINYGVKTPLADLDNNMHTSPIEGINDVSDFYTGMRKKNNTN